MFEEKLETATSTLYRGDCLDVMPVLLDEEINLVLCDMPYGMTRNKWDSAITLSVLWPELLRISSPVSAIILTASQPFTSVLVMSRPDLFRHEWIWIKNRGSNFANTVREPMKEHESALVFSRGKWTYNKQMQKRSGGGASLIGAIQKDKGGKTSNYGGFIGKDILISELRVPSSWQKFNTEVGFHPTQKPVALMEYLIKTYTNEGDTVLDFCMGSGTTGVACIKTGRKFIGIEKEQKYFDIACKRMEQARYNESKQQMRIQL